MTDKIAYYSDMATDRAKVMVYLDPAYKDGLSQLAAAENRSMSNFIETLIIQAVDAARARGELPQVEEESKS